MSERTTRKKMLGGIAALLGVGAGVGVAAGKSLERDEQSAARTLVLSTPRLRIGDPDRKPGAMIAAPSRLEGQANLHDLDGRDAGTFTSVLFPAGGEHVQLHTFSLLDGTLVGMGSVAGFAIVGGTGSYAGARGAYVLDHRPLESGGDGSASFTFDLTA